MDVMYISNLILTVRIGHSAEERRNPQRVRADLRVITDFAGILKTGALADGVNYAALRRTAFAIAEKEFVFLEALADAIAREVLKERKIRRLRVTLRKIDVWDNGMPGVSVERRRCSI